MKKDIAKSIKRQISDLEFQLELLIPQNGCVCENIDIEGINQIKKEISNLNMLLEIMKAKEPSGKI